MYCFRDRYNRFCNMAAWHPFRHVIAGRMGQRHPSPLSCFHFGDTLDGIKPDPLALFHGGCLAAGGRESECCHTGMLNVWRFARLLLYWYALIFKFRILRAAKIRILTALSFCNQLVYKENLRWMLLLKKMATAILTVDMRVSCASSFFYVSIFW